MTGTFGLGTVVLVAGMIVAAGRRTLVAWLLGLTAALALLFNPLFAYTSGMAWNHDASVFLFLCSIAALWRGFITRSATMVGAAGLFLGVAVGTRLTIAPLVAPMIIAVLWHIYVKKMLTPRALIVFIAAGLLTQIPTIVLACEAPARFVWGNIGYAGLNTRLRTDTAFDHAMSLREKIRYLIDVVLPLGNHWRGNWLLLLWALPGIFVACWQRSAPTEGPPDDAPRVPVRLMVALLPFAWSGAVMPTPTWVQYYYVCVPMLLIAGGCAMAQLLARETAGRLSKSLAIGVLLAFTVDSACNLDRDTLGLRWPALNIPLAVHDEGVHLAKRTDGRVLTIDPIYALEGGRPIFPELASGAYAYRVARLMSAEDRKRLLIVGPDEIGERLAAESRSPAILVREPRDVGGRLSHEDDAAIRTFALDHGWIATPLDQRHTLFTMP
jgi:hypothetical protein